MHKKAVVLFSGGQDSTVCLLLATERFGRENVHALSFIYNDAHRYDIDCAKKICKLLGVNHSIYDAGIMNKISNCSSVEGRNLLIGTLALIYAQAHSISYIYIGIALDDVTGKVIHKDCSQEFITTFQACADSALPQQIKIVAPLIRLNKVEIWKIADELGELDLIVDQTYSCWNNIKDHCGHCQACKQRFESLRKYKEIKNGK